MLVLVFVCLGQAGKVEGICIVVVARVVVVVIVDAIDVVVVSTAGGFGWLVRRRK